MGPHRVKRSQWLLISFPISCQKHRPIDAFKDRPFTTHAESGSVPVVSTALTPMTRRVMKVRGKKTRKMKVLWHFRSQLSTQGACGVAYAYWWWLTTHRHKNHLDSNDNTCYRKSEFLSLHSITS